MSRIGKAQAWWAGRTARERWMLAGLGAVVAVLVAWYGVIEPLRGWTRAAEARRQDAAAVLSRVEAGTRTLAGRKTPAALAPAVEASASVAGIAVARRREEADGRLTVWIEGVPSPVLMQWLLLLRQGHGIGVAGLTASKAEQGLDVEVSLAGR